jgi:uncharacterized membrane protein HdeD (DUF308 family)
VIVTGLLAFLAYRYDRHIQVYVTAFMGAYAFVRGISMFAGNFPNEITTFTSIIAGTFTLSSYFYIYMGSFVVLFLIGVIVQRKLGFHLHKSDDEGYTKQN